jgi:hypothetical protein
VTAQAPPRPASAAAPSPASAAPSPAIPRPSRRSPWRLPAILAGVVLLGGLVIAWLQVGVPGGYLDPGNTGPDGGHALAAILAGRGEPITAVTTASKATAAKSTILVTNPQLLTQAELNALASTPASLVVVDPDQATLDALAPGITIAGHTGIKALNPGCTLPAATAAGDADMGGTLLRATTTPIAECYSASLITYHTAGHQVTVLGTGAPFTNQHLADHGNAALALNLLRDKNLIWLTPQASPATPPATGQGTKSFTSLIPEPVYMIAAELGIAVVLLALWRMRRLGPVVPERLPAVVRAAETAEGHGRLYHARRSRDQAAAHLREATTRRLIPLLGLPPDAAPGTVAQQLAARIPSDGNAIAQILSGPRPDNDAALVELADKLDELERKAGNG